MKQSFKRVSYLNRNLLWYRVNFNASSGSITRDFTTVQFPTRVERRQIQSVASYPPHFIIMISQLFDFVRQRQKLGAAYLPAY